MLLINGSEESSITRNRRIFCKFWLYSVRSGRTFLRSTTSLHPANSFTGHPEDVRDCGDRRPGSLKLFLSHDRFFDAKLFRYITRRFLTFLHQLSTKITYRFLNYAPILFIVCVKIIVVFYKVNNRSNFLFIIDEHLWP